MRLVFQRCRLIPLRQRAPLKDAALFFRIRCVLAVSVWKHDAVSLFFLFLFFLYTSGPRVGSRAQRAAPIHRTPAPLLSFILFTQSLFFSLFRLHGDEMQKAAARLTFCEMQTADEIPVISGATNAKKKTQRGGCEQTSISRQVVNRLLCGELVSCRSDASEFMN